MTTAASPLSWAPLQPEIDQACAEWADYKKAPSHGCTADQLRVVQLARRILDHQLEIFSDVREGHRLSVAQEASFYKIFSRAAKVHFALKERLFSPRERLAIVRLLQEVAPSKMAGAYKNPLTLLRRLHSEIVANRLGWQLLMGIHFEENLLQEGGPAVDPSFYHFEDQEREAHVACRHLIASVPKRESEISARPVNLICLRSIREIALFSMYMGVQGPSLYSSRGLDIQWWPLKAGEYEKQYAAGTTIFQKASSALDTALMLDRMLPETWTGCPIIVSLPLEEVLRLHHLTTPEGDCVKAAIAAKRVVIEEDLSNFETYLFVLRTISDSIIAAGVRAKNGAFVVSERGNGLELRGITRFSHVDGPANRALYEASADALAEWECFSKNPSTISSGSLGCVSLCRQLIRIVFPFVENPSLECPLILSQDRPRLYALIESALLADLHSRTALFTVYERDWLRRMLYRFCPELMVNEADCVRIESLGESISINKNLMILLFREYSLGVMGRHKQLRFETIGTDGLLKDGLQALRDYFEWVHGTLRLTPRQALQVISFFKRMSCEAYLGANIISEIVEKNLSNLCGDSEVFHNHVLVGDLLTIACEKVQELSDIVRKVQASRNHYDAFFSGYSEEEERLSAEESAVQEFLSRGT